MESMVVSASTGVMNSLLSKLSVLLSDRYKQLKGIRRDIEFLNRELTDMNAALEKLESMWKLDGQTKVWRDKVREMAYDIEDCIDIFMHHHDQGDDRDDLFHKVARKIKRLRVRYQLANKIEELKTRVEEQSQSRGRYKIDESTSISTVVEVDPRLAALYEDAKSLVGIDGPREEIIKWLMDEGDSDSEELIKVVSIVGFGGLGKTTLANQVYMKIKDEFECTALVTVSRIPDTLKVINDILFGVGYGSTEMLDDVQKLIQILREHLENKRYLIVIDDIWSINAWDIIKCAFPQNNNGSRVITTTCIQDVATASCFPYQEHVYQMQPLDELHSKRLFFKRVFGKEDACPVQFKEISDDISRKCKGVPLAITSIASLLANQSMYVETWEQILNSLGSELDTNPRLDWMYKVLTLSYNDLSRELKTCMLYLGTYPEDHAIGKVDLLRKWIAEGFVKEKHGLDLEEVAENYFNQLINRNMIEPYFHDYAGEVSECKVHDLMLDLIISKCTEENFITIIDRQFKMNRASQVRRISHQFNNKGMALSAEVMSLSHVRSYNSFPEADCMPPLSKFEVLRVLHMDMGYNAYVTSESMCLDLSAINHLFLLRYLKVTGFRLELPKKFGKLNHLMTLDISSAELNSGNQSSDFTSLSSLRHLSLPMSGRSEVVMTNGLSTLCNLCTLDGLEMGENSIECIGDLGALSNLRELNLKYLKQEYLGEEEISETGIPIKYDILAASLDKLGNSNLREFNLAFLDGHGGTGPSTQFWSDCFTSPRRLRKVLFPSKIPKVPKWIAYADRLAYVFSLPVQELQSDDVKVLGQLPCLTYLYIQANTVQQKNIVIHPNTFTSLKHFQVYCELLPCLTFEPSGMPRLQKLKICFDGRKQGAVEMQKGSLVAGIEHLANIKDISVDVRGIPGYGSTVESAWRDAIFRHPKCEAIQICLYCNGIWVDTGVQSQSLAPEEANY